MQIDPPVITHDDLDAMGFSARTTDERLASARTLLRWAELGPNRWANDVDEASILVAAGDQFEFAGDLDQSIAVLRRAVDAPGNAVPDTRAYLLNTLLDAGHHDEAREIADTIRRESPTDPLLYEMIAESFEIAGDDRHAMRWFSMGLRLIDREDVELSEADYRVLLNGRWRVRRSLELPEDVLDAEAAAFQAQRSD